MRASPRSSTWTTRPRRPSPPSSAASPGIYNVADDEPAPLRDWAPHTRRRSGRSGRCGCRVARRDGRRAAARSAWRRLAARRLQRQGQARAGLAAAARELAPGLSRGAAPPAEARRAAPATNVGATGEPGELRDKGVQMAYEVPDLPYDYDALEPHIDEATMRVHHDKHHQAYVDKANAALEGTEWADKDVDEVLQNLTSLPDDKQGPVRNNAGGHANHTLLLADHEPGRRRRARRATSPRRSTRSSAPSTPSRRSSRTPGSASSAPAGRGWSTTAPASRSPRRPTRTRRSPTARRRCSASTSGSTPTT